MECKFINHGVSFGYDQVLKPCCDWIYEDHWQQNHHISRTNIINWHQHPDIVRTRNMLADGIWPKSCVRCKNIEEQGRSDSTRGNGNQAYSDYSGDNITLEIRPGSTCNFACQTCWPEASSRVAQYFQQANLIDIKSLDSTRIDNFDFLQPVSKKIKNVVVLGGEPFYDKSCLKFINWAYTNLNANLIMFTNGSCIDFSFIENYPGKITLVFSIDAVGKPAEYIRFGTIWKDVLANFKRSQAIKKLEVRVNITCSIYNYVYLKDVIDLLCEDWPSVVSFGTCDRPTQRESSVPVHMRGEIKQGLEQALKKIQETDIEFGQKSNALNAIKSIIINLDQNNFNPHSYTEFCNFVNLMDSVKNIQVSNYCEFLSRLIKPV